ncbi:MAG: protein kinase [Bradymonadaceae bacterium]
MTVDPDSDETSRSWTKFGRYALLDKIGSGGMAEIYRAKTFGAAGFEKEYAIKLITPSLVDDNEFVDMFISEAKIVVNLYHANIVQVFDLGEIDGQYYIAMEYVHGKDLLDILARCAKLNIKLPLDLVLFITMEMLKGLNFAHDAKDPFGDDLNIIHRDISPANILVSYTGNVKVGDFGVAKAAIERSISDDETLKGKVGYMSPEQVTGQELDARSDIFSAGIVFAEALGMTRLFTGDSDLDVMLQVRDADIEESLERMQPLPTGLEEIAQRALAKHPERRYQTAEDFYQALVDFCFQHDIKVGDNDLSNLMGRLFEEEIEREKTRRRQDPSRPVSEDREPVESAPEEHTPRQSRVPEADSKHPPTPETDRAAVDSGADQASTAELADDPDATSRVQGAGETQQPDESSPAEQADPSEIRRQLYEADFHFRGGDGDIKGPLQLDELLDVLRNRAPDPADRVSIDGGPWRPPNTVLDEVSLQESTVPDSGGSEAAEAPSSAPADPSTVEAREPETDRSETEEPTTAGSLDLEATVKAMEEMSASLQGEETPVGNAEFQPEDETESPEPSDVEPALETQDFDMDSIEELREQYLSYEGDLDETPFPRLLGQLHLGSATGRLHVQRNTVEKSIYLRDGEPIMVDSNREEELLGAFLLSKGEITRDELDQALARLHEWGGRLGDALVAIGAVQAHNIYELLSEQMEEKLLDVFEWPDGRYGFYEGQEPDTKGYPLGVDPLELVVQGCRERVPLDLITEYYENRRQNAIYLRDQPPVHPEDLSLDTNEQRVLTQISDDTTPKDLLDESDSDALDRETSYRVLFLLDQLGVLAFRGTGSKELSDFE